MCTRYYVEMSPELRPFVDAAEQSPLRKLMVSKLGKPFKGRGEIRPTDMAAVIAMSRSGKRSVFPMIWGYTIPGIGRPVVNARLETAKYRRTFSDGWREHRCVIPASWYYEWEHVRRPDGRTKAGAKYAIQPENSDVTFLAGLYRMEEQRGFCYPVFVVLTRAPGEDLLKIHDRMPLILPPDAARDWIRPEVNPEKTAGKALTDMAIEREKNE